MNELAEIINGSIPQLSAASLFMLFFFATFVSEDLACLAAGAAVVNGQIGFAAVVAACLLGIFVGDMLLFAAGRMMGSSVFENRLTKRFISTEARSKASRWLETNGAAAVFLSRFATGLRLPTYLAAGALRTDTRKFALYFLIASAIWTPLLVGSVAFAQSLIFRGNLLLSVLAVFIFARLVTRYSTWKNRRMLIGRLKRVTNWEFWPIQVFYAPVVIYIFWLGIRFRSLIAFTAANPAIPAAGFKGESKDEIYKLLAKNPDELLPHRLIPADLTELERLDSALEFIKQYNMPFPVVVKPDAGERGKDVRIVYGHDELADALKDHGRRSIVQQYVGGKEVSIFYYRKPKEARGHIFSITEKRFPTVRGDGRSTVEELTFSDRRAVALAKKYVEYNADRLIYIPAIDEHISLIDIGTHSRGAIFLDGEHLRTSALESRIDEICQQIDGFYFGRFDIRVPSFDDLRRGENLKIIELNGVTSESTNIYDPKFSLIDAYRILFRQWRIAFEIGAENSRLGARRESIVALAKMAFG